MSELIGITYRRKHSRRDPVGDEDQRHIQQVMQSVLKAESSAVNGQTDSAGCAAGWSPRSNQDVSLVLVADAGWRGFCSPGCGRRVRKVVGVWRGRMESTDWVKWER